MTGPMKSAASTDSAHAIEGVSGALAEWIVQRQFELDPTLDQRYGPKAQRMWRTEVQSRLRHLAQAVAVGCPSLFLGSTGWSKIAFASRDVALSDLRLSLECTVEVLGEHLPAVTSESAVAIVSQAIAGLESMPEFLASHVGGTGPWAELALQYLTLLLEHKREEAAQLVLGATEEGATFESIALEVIQPALAEVGRLWHMNQLSIVEEHYCTAASGCVLSQAFRAALAARPPKSKGRTALITGVGGEVHELGPRVVANFLEIDGWSPIFLGVNSPAEEIVELLSEGRIDLLALSVGTNLAVGAAKEQIALVRATRGLEGVRVLVGGAPFNMHPELWREVGADGCASDARQAVEVANRLVGG